MNETLGEDELLGGLGDFPNMVEEVEKPTFIAQLDGLNITSIHQLLEPGLPRKELLVRTLEQIHEQTATMTRLRYKLEGAIVALRSLHWIQNSLQLFRFLPDEILVDIFRLSSSDDPTLQPIRLSHVCQHWRELALGAPVLWSSVQFDKLVIAHPFLNRSKSAPIDVHIGIHTTPARSKYVKPLISLLRAHAPRVRRLHLSVHPQEKNNDVLFSYLEALHWCSVPELKELVVKHPGAHPIDSTRGMLALSGIFKNEEPPLERLDFSCIPVPWGTPVLAGGRLTYLRISKQSPPPPGAIIALLRSHPQLEEVELQRFAEVQNGDPIYHVVSADASGEHTCAALPRLRRLILDTVDLPHDTFLASIDAPLLSSGILRIAHVGLRDANDARLGIARILGAPRDVAGHLPSFRGEAVRAVRWEGESWHRCEVTFFREHQRQPGSSHRALSYMPHGRRQLQLEPQLSFSLRDSAEWAFPTFRSLATMQLSNLHAMHLLGLVKHDPDAWHLRGFTEEEYREVFVSLPSVRDLVLEGCAWDLLLLVFGPGRLIVSSSLEGAHEDEDRREDGQEAVEAGRYMARTRSVLLPRLESLLIVFGSETTEAPEGGAEVLQNVVDLICACVLARRHSVEEYPFKQGFDSELEGCGHEETVGGGALQTFTLALPTHRSFSDDSVSRFEDLHGAFQRNGSCKLSRTEPLRAVGIPPFSSMTESGIDPDYVNFVSNIWEWSF